MELKTTRLWLLPLALLIAFSGAAEAQEPMFSIALSGGLAGSIDEDTGFSNLNFQVRFAIETAHQRLLSVRVGRMDFSGESMSLLLEPAIDYVTIAGEYMYNEGSYESGVFYGLGYYDASGVRLDGTDGGQGALGFVFGALGEFDVAERWFVYGEATFHYIDLDAAQMFADLQIGLGFRF
jgi:hypothetical protein